MTTPYWLRLMIAVDALIECSWRDGKVGITMSSRIGTAAAHDHRWGLAAAWLIERSWPLRLIFGLGHCAGAVRHDIERAQAAIAELTDLVVQEYVRAHAL